MFQPGASGRRGLAATAQSHRHEGAEDRGGAGQRAGAPNGLARRMKRAITARVLARILGGGGMQIGAAGWAGNDATSLAIVQRQLCSLVGQWWVVLEKY